VADEEKRIDGLGFDKLVYDYLAHLDTLGDRQKTSMNIGAAEKEIGLSGPTILRAVSVMREKGYPVISNSTRRTWENDFVIAKNQREYLAWRDKMIDDIRTLEDVLRACDKAARVKWGADLPMQQVMF